MGVPNTIKKLASHKLQSTLAVSLHIPNQKQREVEEFTCRKQALADLDFGDAAKSKADSFVILCTDSSFSLLRFRFSSRVLGLICGVIEVRMLFAIDETEC